MGFIIIWKEKRKNTVFLVFFKVLKTPQSLRLPRKSDTQVTKTHHKIIFNIASFLAISL